MGSLLDLVRRMWSLGESASLYLHFPCFDGIVSGVLAWEFLEKQLGWRIKNIEPINYDARHHWLNTKLPPNAGVVDFLYNPSATFWADHHPTTFLTKESKLDFELNKKHRYLFYDDKSPSCAELLLNVAGNMGADLRRFEDMVNWANKIDSAGYESVDEAIFGLQPAIRIDQSLACDSDKRYCELLLTHLRYHTLEEVANLPEVNMRFQQVRQRVKLGIDRVEPLTRLINGNIAVLQAVEEKPEIIHRYAPYHFYPQASYSIAEIRTARGTKITAMRNPWKQFESVHLGHIFDKYGGGGHKRVASLFVRSDEAVGNFVDEIAAEILEKDRLDVGAT